MKLIEDNRPLTEMSLLPLIARPNFNLIVNPVLGNTARILTNHFIENFKYEYAGEKITVEEAVKFGLIKVKVIINEGMEKTSWLLLTEKNIYYSTGEGK